MVEMNPTTSANSDSPQPSATGPEVLDHMHPWRPMLRYLPPLQKPRKRHSVAAPHSQVSLRRSLLSKNSRARRCHIPDQRTSLSGSKCPCQCCRRGSEIALHRRLPDLLVTKFGLGYLVVSRGSLD
ncbi:hypothetical protein RF11_01530 [Thelohanellus kitauei]|uniref:Uncharacterized protein n=1 Tax=Thelohanellus kitauei TaxID=669202 RepID=A0A0C2MNZ9_THEKT|nr:hypothetical protein RF11_01530 [Thelohanellus kitauei]